MNGHLFLFCTLLLLYSCEATKQKSVFSAVNLILKSYHTNLITIYNPSAYLDVDIVGNIKLTTQDITVVNNFTYLPLRCNNGPCPTKRRSHFGKVLLFFPSSTNPIRDYYSRLEENKKSEQNPVSIFLTYFDGTKSVELRLLSDRIGYRIGSDNRRIGYKIFIRFKNRIGSDKALSDPISKDTSDGYRSDIGYPKKMSIGRKFYA